MEDEKIRRITGVFLLPLLQFDKYTREMLSYIREAQPVPVDSLVDLAAVVPPNYIRSISSQIAGALNVEDEDSITKVLSYGIAEILVDMLATGGLVAKTVNDEGVEVVSLTRKGELVLNGVSSEEDYVVLATPVEPERDSYYLYPGRYIAVLDEKVDEPSIAVPDCLLGLYEPVVRGRIIRFNTAFPLRLPVNCTVKLYPLRD